MLLDLGGVGVTSKGAQGIAGDEGEASVPARWLLSRLDDDTRRFEFGEGVVGLALVHRDVDEQAGRLHVVEQGIDLTSKLEEGAVVLSNARFRKGQGLGDISVMFFWIVPDDQGVVFDLPGDQTPQRFRYQTTDNLRLLIHVGLPSSVSVFWVSAIGSSTAVKGAKSGDSKSER